MGARAWIAGFLLVAACGDSFPEPEPQMPPPDVDPDAVPEIILFNASSVRIHPRETIELSWDVKNARAIELYDRDETLVSTFAANGRITTAPIRRDKKFYLRALNREKVATAELAIVVDWVPPTIEYVRTIQAQVPIDTNTELAWMTTKADVVQIELDGIEVFRSEVDDDFGMRNLLLTRELTRVKLTASNQSGTVSEELDVHAVKPPRIARFAVQPRVWLGGTQTVMVHWQATDASVVELFYYPVPVGEGFEIPEARGTLEGSVELEIQSMGYYQFSAMSMIGSAFVQGRITAPVPESEPNNIRENSSFTIGGAVGAISDASDVDFYEIGIGEVLSGLRIYTLGAGGRGCEVDTKITVHDWDSVLFSASDGGDETASGGRCARLELSAEEIFLLRESTPYVYVAVESENDEAGGYALFTEEL